MKALTNQAGCGYLQPVFFVLALLVLLSACSGNSERPESTQESCTKEITSIADIQGTTKTSPLLGTAHTVRGIVTYITNHGLYLEQTLADTNLQTADGIFVDSETIAKQARPGDLLQLSGTVAELHQPDQPNNNSLTSLEQITAYQTCARQQPLPVSTVQLPLSADERESLEAMRVEITQELTVTDVYQLHQRQQLTLAAGGQKFTATEIMLPGSEARQQNQTNRLAMLQVQLPQSTTASAEAQVGDLAHKLSGIMTQQFGNYQLLSESSLELVARELPVLPAKNGNLRLLSFNLYNLFNGDGMEQGFPAPRGARTYPEFLHQIQQLAATIIASEADLVAFQEIENDGYDPNSTIADLKNTLNKMLPEANWEYAKPAAERLGDSPISVGIIYRSNRLQALGPALTNNEKPFQQLSRQPLAQLFQDKQHKAKFLVAANHFKSKGGCPQLKSDLNANQQDGQACWNMARVEAAETLSNWLNRLRNFSANENMIILGDLNSYRKEDPLRKLIDQGWIDLVEENSTQPQYSFIFFGQAGTLDYALATPALATRLVQALNWNINSPIAPDSPLRESGYLRSSDHDPVIVDLDLSTTPSARNL